MSSETRTVAKGGVVGEEKGKQLEGLEARWGFVVAPLQHGRQEGERNHAHETSGEETPEAPVALVAVRGDSRLSNAGQRSSARRRFPSSKLPPGNPRRRNLPSSEPRALLLELNTFTFTDAPCCAYGSLSFSLEHRLYEQSRQVPLLFMCSFIRSAV